MALDLGTKTIGLALSDPGRTIASSLGVVRRRGWAHDAAELRKVVREHEVCEIVLGLPLHLDGRESEGSRRSREFGDRLAAELCLPVHLVDESLTTAEAEEVLIAADVSRKKRKRSIDGLAAAVLLRSYLNELDEARPAPGVGV